MTAPAGAVTIRTPADGARRAASRSRSTSDSARSWSRSDCTGPYRPRSGGWRASGVTVPPTALFRVFAGARTGQVRTPSKGKSPTPRIAIAPAMESPDTAPV